MPVIMTQRVSPDAPIATPRLLLRAAGPEDVDDLVAMDGDPEVRRYLDMPEAPTRDHTLREIVPKWQAIRAACPGQGFWTAREEQGGEFVGWFHLRAPKPGTPQRQGDLELGYRLVRRRWGLGFATEGSMALLRHGFGVLRRPRVIASALAGNGASIGVMKKIGMTLDQEWLYKGTTPAVVYARGAEGTPRN